MACCLPAPGTPGRLAVVRGSADRSLRTAAVDEGTSEPSSWGRLGCMRKACCCSRSRSHSVGYIFLHKPGCRFLLRHSSHFRQVELGFLCSTGVEAVLKPVKQEKTADVI